MSSLWKYIQPIISNGLIKKIELADIYKCSNPPIYVWRVVMKDNNVYDLSNQKFKTYLDNHDLSKYDKKALFEAFENNTKLTKENIMKIYTKEKIF
jgi:hypothetical protein